MGLGLITCGEGELVGGVHPLVGGVVQVYHRLQVLEEEEEGRKVGQEIEKENQGEENAQMTMHMWMSEWLKLSEHEPQRMCVRMM